VKCAAFELPFKTCERFGGIDVQQILAILAEENFVHLSPGSSPDAEGQWHWTSESYPADAVSLRSISSDNFVVVDMTEGARVIGETDFGSGPSTLHPKAVYIVEAKLYQVERLDFENRKAYVRAIDCDYYTDAITYTRVTILDTFANGARPPQLPEDSPEREWDDREEPLTSDQPPMPGDPTRSHGEVHVVSRVVGFKKIKFYTNENVGSGELDLPEQQMHTTSYWLTIPREVMSALPYAADDRRDGVVGLSFAMRQIAQLLLMCDRNDIGISVGPGDGQRPADASGRERSRTPDFNLDEPQIFIYDNYPGGIGFSEPLFDMHASLLAHTRELIEGCPCEFGCPTCVGPVGDIGPSAKAVALDILARLSVARDRRSANLASAS
jgi:DEAD/DEAH box helicase domain-containing protein